MSAGGYHTCALRNDGIVRCWGDNDWGQIGDGSTVPRLTPVTVQGLSGVVAIATGQTASCGLQADGDLYCWGAIGGDTFGNLPQLVASGVVAVDIGDNHACWAATDGEAYCRGQDIYGQLGCDGMSTPDPWEHVIGAAGIVHLASGDNHNLALAGDGSVVAWGRGDSGQLGEGRQLHRDTAVTSLFGVPTP